MLFCVVIIKAQNFPIQYKIERVFDECSACHAKTRSIWKLVQPESYSETIRKAIEHTIFTQNSYPEKLNYYLKEEAYQKPCEVTVTSKHVWLEKKLFQNETLSKDEYANFEQNEKEQNDKIKREKDKEQQLLLEKQKSNDAFKNSFSNFQNKRENAKALLEKNDIENYLKLQLEICKEGKKFDSIINSKRNRTFEDYEESRKIDEILNQYYCDLSNYILVSLKEKKVLNTNFVLNNFGRVDDIKILLEASSPCKTSLAVNLTHSILLQKNLNDYWAPRVRLFESNLFPILFEDYQDFEKRGLLNNADSLIFILNAEKELTKVNVSQNAPDNVKYYVKNSYIQETIKKNYKSLIKIDKNLYKFIYKDRKDALIDNWNYTVFYVYINKNYDIVIVNKSLKEPSEKRKLKIINLSKEIRDKDLNIK